MRTSQSNIFTGMNTDVNEGLLQNQTYHLAYNIQRVNHRYGIGFTLSAQDETVSQRAGDIEIDISSVVPLDYEVRALFECTANYEDGQERASVVMIVSDPVSGNTKILIIRTDTHEFFMIYDDDQPPVRERWEPLNVGPEVDGFTWSDSREHYLYWTDNINPLRYIPLRVNNLSVVDNSTAPNSPLYIANEPDLLYVQKLWPADVIDVDDVIQTGGGLTAGSYQFCYQYFNTQTKIKSRISLITNPVPVILSNTSEVSSNKIEGGGPGHNTGKSIQVSIDKQHFHHAYYDSVILFVVKRIGSEVPVVDKLAPSTEFYGSLNATSTFVYTGNEKVSASTVQDITVVESDIQTAKTIVESDGRMYLGEPTFWNVDFPMPPDIFGETIIHEMQVSVDPMNSITPATGIGYADEMNCYRYRGFFRGEVYRAGLSYVNKFGFWAFIKNVPFPNIPTDRYNPLDHANSYIYNYAEPEVLDWKFADRQSQETCLFSQTQSAIRAFGFKVAGISNQPDWAYGMAIFRRKRVKNIVGQTPVIQSMAVHGGSSPVSQEIQDETRIVQGALPYEDSTNWSYGGDQDTLVPRILAAGAHKHLFLYGMPILTPAPLEKRIYTLVSEWAYMEGISESQIGREFVPVYYLYPMEYLANFGEQPFADFDQNQKLQLEVIDVVALDIFSTIRRNDIKNNPGGTGADKFNELAYVYSPKGKSAYYYYNHGPYNLSNTVGNNGLPILPSVVKVSDIFPQIHKGPPIIVGDPLGYGRKTAHIDKIDNLQSLIDQQVSDENNIMRDLDLLKGNVVYNPRALIIKAESGSNQIYDLVKYIDEQYGALGYGNLFPTQDYLYIDAEGTKYNDAQLAQASSLVSNLSLSPPNHTTPVVIANITKGLSDDRYGTNEVANDYIFTGSYLPLTKDRIDSPIPIQMDVWGGDCYISPAAFQIRSNAPRAVEAGPNADENRQYFGAYNSGDYLDNGHVRVSGRKFFHEVIHLWVESEVNAHQVFRETNSYPFGFENKDDIGVGDGTAEYIYPEGASFDVDLFSIKQLYNAGYSSENDLASWTSLDLELSPIDKAKARVAFSLQRVPNGSQLGFDTWLTGNIFDLQGTYGSLTKLVLAAGKRLYAIQEDGVAVLMLGSTMTEDANGFALNIKSGNVIGYSQYVSSNNETGGDFGGQQILAIKAIEDGIIVYDNKRQRIFKIGPGIQDISYGVVSKYIAHEPAVADPSTFRMGYDPIDGRFIFWSKRGFSNQGLAYLNRKGQYEGIMASRGLMVQAMASNGGTNYVGIKSDTEGLKLFRFMANQEDRRLYFGAQEDASIIFPINSGSVVNAHKTVYSVEVQSVLSIPTIITYVAEELNNNHLYKVSIATPVRKRQNSWFYNQFRELGQEGKRVQDANIYLGLIIVDVAQPVSISSVKTNIRVKDRK